MVDPITAPKDVHGSTWSRIMTDPEPCTICVWIDLNLNSRTINDPRIEVCRQCGNIRTDHQAT